jgi:hypothetical protein
VVQDRSLDYRDLELTRLCADTDLTDSQIVALYHLRVQIRHGRYSEVTMEAKRQAFARWLVRTGHLTIGAGNGPTVKQVPQYVDFAGGRIAWPPAYSGGC